MEKEILNPIILAAFSVLEMILGNTPDKGEFITQENCKTSPEVNVVCGVTGTVRGQLIFSMSEDTAVKIASTMFGQKFEDLDSLAESAISELGNMISGNALQQLSQVGFVCDITPPALIRGNGLKISTVLIPGTTFPLCVDEGTIFITAGIERAPEALLLASA